LAENKVSEPVVAQQPHPKVSPPISPEQYFRDCTTFPARFLRLTEALKFLGATEAEAEDAIQGALEQLLRDWDKVREPQKWVPKVALRRFYKEKTRGPKRLVDRLVEEGDVMPEGDGGQQISVWEDRRWVSQMLKSLTSKQRVAMTLITEGLEPSEIADLLGTTPGAVRQSLLQARTRLRREMQPEADGGSDLEAQPSAHSERNPASIIQKGGPDDYA
jgi:RNA polymerase sigma factor (sigma-70 family)